MDMPKAGNEKAQEWLEGLAAREGEPLDPDLVDCVEDSELWGKTLKHPLVIQLPHFSNAMANDVLNAKRKALNNALNDEEWHTVIFLHERPWRTDALVEYVVGIDEQTDKPFPLAELEQWRIDLACSVWIDSENLQQVTEEWDAMLEGEGLVLATVEDRVMFEALDDPLTVYRGDIDDGGWSWSLDRTIAEFFAKRFGADAPLVMGEVSKVDVRGYLTGRGESEVLVPEGKVRNVRGVE